MIHTGQEDKKGLWSAVQALSFDKTLLHVLFDVVDPGGKQFRVIIPQIISTGKCHATGQGVQNPATCDII